MCFQLEVYFDRFAESKEAFFEAYSKAHTKLSELGSKFEPAEGWGPGGMGGWSGKLLDGIFLVAKKWLKFADPFFFGKGFCWSWLSGENLNHSGFAPLFRSWAMDFWCNASRRIFAASRLQIVRGDLPFWPGKDPMIQTPREQKKKTWGPFLLYLRFWKNQRHFF